MKTTFFIINLMLITQLYTSDRHFSPIDEAAESNNKSTQYDDGKSTDNSIYYFNSLLKRSITSDIKDILMAGSYQDLINFLKDKDLSSIPYTEENPLIMAIYFQKPHAIQILAQAGARVDIKNDDGQTLIDIAYKHSSPEMVAVLIIAQAHLIISDIKEILINGSNKDLIDLLKDKDLSNIPYTKEHPFMMAISFNKPDAIQILAKAGAKVDMKDGDGQTLIDIAYKHSSPEMVAEFLTVQADQIIKNRESSLTPAFLRSLSVSPFCPSPKSRTISVPSRTGLDTIEEEDDLVPAISNICIKPAQVSSRKVIPLK